MCDSFGNQCFYLTMNKDHKTCSHCDYDCDNIQHTTSFVIRQTNPEEFCDQSNAVDYPLTDIKSYIDERPMMAQNPKYFYLKWKALVDDKPFHFNITELCHWKAKNDFAIVHVYLAAPMISRLKQDIKVPLHAKLSLLGNYSTRLTFCISKITHI